ncbi:integrator complex subunit 6-A-like isoform X2 [Hemitrygon akajei]|uniref:integrator complex subunit 6-A-like isoform X2 n=1 Tax=Hemitrygon akajei TaxID=2704970 RepID=UPI003BF99EB4
MPILLFLIDTSASMSQRTHLGTTYLDIAKGAVETFMKLRARDPASRGDRYMLVSFDEPPYGIKAGWKENHATFMNELKNLQAVGLSTLGQSLRTSFDLLNLNRLVTGIDNYGQGRQDLGRRFTRPTVNRTDELFPPPPRLVVKMFNFTSCQNVICTVHAIISPSGLYVNKMTIPLFELATLWHIYWSSNYSYLSIL